MANRGPDAQRDLIARPIRLGTLVQLRWVAIAGQLAAVAVGLWLGLAFNLPLVLLCVGASVALNLALQRAPRLPDEREVAVQLGFDLAQMTLLLALTGGLANPFALLLLVPVTIAAAALDLPRVVQFGLATVALISVLAIAAEPLRLRDGTPLELTPLLGLGQWMAIVIGAGFFAAYAHRVASELRVRGIALAAAEMALAREQKLQHLGGVVAAAAHEMGTPLATIKLVTGELRDELDDRPDLASDLALLASSADRCRDILRSMGHAGKDDLQLRAAPLTALIDEAAAPHRARGRIEVVARPDPGAGPEPVVRREAGVVHGLRNLVQNGVDFAAEAVRIEAAWSAAEIRVTIADDGAGFPPALLGRIGEPFLSTRRPPEARAGYEGMGLGLFIARTLLERSGARLAFRNATPGAVVEVSWPRARLEAEARGGLGANPEITG